MAVHDPVDARLLALVAEVGRVAVHDLANRAGMDVREVAARLAGLAASGLPLVVGVECDPTALRYALTAPPRPLGPPSGPIPVGQPPGPYGPPMLGRPSRGGPHPAAYAGPPTAPPSGPYPGAPGAAPPGPPVAPPATAPPGPATGPQAAPPTGPQAAPPTGPATGPQAAPPTGPQAVPPTGPPPGLPTGPQPVPQGVPQTGARAGAQAGSRAGPQAAFGPSAGNGVDPVGTWGPPGSAAWARGDELDTTTVRTIPARRAARSKRGGTVGDTLQGVGPDGEPLEIRLVEVVDPADFLFTAAGHRLQPGERSVVVHTEVTNRGGAPLQVPPDLHLVLLDAGGEATAKAPVALSSRPPYRLGVRPGETAGGHTVYVLPEGTDLAAVRWTATAEDDEQRALTWTVRPA